MNRKLSIRFLLTLTLVAAMLSAPSCADNPAETETKLPAGDIDRYKQYTREALPDSLVAEVTRIHAGAVAAGDYETTGTSALILANRCARTDDYDGGIALMEDYVERVSASTGDPATLFEAHFKTGEFYYVNGFQNIALDYFLEAAPHAPDDRKKGLIYYAIGISSVNIREASAGIDPGSCFLMAEELSKKTGDSLIVAQALFGRAGRYFDFLNAYEIKDEPLLPARRDSIDAAVTLLRQAVEFAPLGVLDYALGLSYAALKDFERAQYHIERVTGDGYSPMGMNVRASLFVCMGRYAEAVAMAQEAYEKGEETSNETDMRNSLHILYYACKYSGETAQALDAFERYAEKRQRLMDESFERQVNVSQVRFDTRLKEERLAATEKENSLYRRGLLIVGCAFLVVAELLGLVVSYYRKIRKAHRALVQKSLQWAREPVSVPTVIAGRDDTERRVLVEKLDDLMSREKPYLRPDLTISEVAGALEINRTYLSDAVNRVLGNSFTTYLNELRIRDAVNLISDPSSDQYTVDGLARMAGFSNRKTFHNAFVRTTGLTPSEFRRNRDAADPSDKNRAPAPARI